MKTGTGWSGTCGGRSPAIGSPISSSAASHLKNCRSARNWLLAYAALYRSSSQTIHRCTSCLPACSQQVRPASRRRRAAANHCTASVQVRTVLAALPSAARYSRNELISGWKPAASSCLGCR